MLESCSGSPDSLARFGRSIDLLTMEGFQRVRSAFVVVVGLGGVGGHAASALVRAGVGRLRIVDFDKVTLSSLNRSAFATPQEVGQAKVEVVKRFLEQVDPEVRVEVEERFFHLETADAILGGQPSYVVDAIDSVNPKVALLTRCHAAGIPVVSCMGASGRTDPTALRIHDISATRICPLARVIRKQLRKAGIDGGICAVYSVERPRQPFPPDLAEETLRRGRIRNRLPSLGIMPGIIGYSAAAVVIAHLAGLPPPGSVEGLEDAR